MPDVFLRRESDSELRFAHPVVSGWIFAAIGVAVVYIAGQTIASTPARWMTVGIGLLFAAIGVGGALWRYELSLDLLSRTYRKRRGFWPSPRSREGSLNELRGVSLSRTWRRADDSSSAVWVVSLEFEGWETPVSVFETASERKGYRRLEQLARRLQASAIDRTGDEERIRPAGQLDRPLLQSDDHRAVEGPPPASRIERTTTETGEPMIVLPPMGFSWAAVFVAILGTPFLAFGAIALLSAVGWRVVEVKGSLAALWIVGGVFVVVGTILWAAAIFGPIAREVIRREGDALVITLRAFGRHYRRRRLPLGRIEEVSIKPSRSARSEKTEVVLRTDAIVARIAGELPPDGQRWLSRALLAMARR